MQSAMSGEGEREPRRARSWFLAARWLLLPSIVSLVSACGDGLTEPPEALSAAWWHNACGPVDQPAVALYLGESVPTDAQSPPYPHLRISIYLPAVELPGRTVQWDSGSSTDVGHAWYCAAEGDCETATSFMVEFYRSDDAAIFGHLSYDYLCG
jgi:hypothetical protein